MDIFPLLNDEGAPLSPIRQASVFAKYSRSPESARTLAQKTDETNAEAFQQKVIVDFGHNSVAELATIPVAFEGVSIIASKAIEAWQRPGVSEKSTRMQEFDRDSVHIPEGLDRPFQDVVSVYISNAFRFYEKLLVQLPPILARRYPDLKDLQIKRMTFDTARYLLPAGCKTNLGICAYPRDLAEMISTFTGSLNPEFVEIGTKLKKAVSSIGGPLIRHTEADTWVNQLSLTPPVFIASDVGDVVQLRSYTPSEERLLSILGQRYGYSTQDWRALMELRPKHHAAPHAFREARLNFYVQMDYGAFRDLQRHRRMEQFVGFLTPNLGFSVPEELEDHRDDPEANKLSREFRKTLGVFMGLQPWPRDPQQVSLAQYVLPLAFRVPWSISMDLQQLYYLVELRTAPAGHISYRKVAYNMLVEARKIFPFFTQWVRAEPC